MARKRRLNSFHAGELNLTAMIDVAFQLLAFFIITTHPVDVMAGLDVLRPAAIQGEEPVTPPGVRVAVFADGYTVNETRYELDQMIVKLGKLAALDKSQTVLIQCINDAPHGRLVELLDACAMTGLTNLSVVSSGGQ